MSGAVRHPRGAGHAARTGRRGGTVDGVGTPESRPIRIGNVEREQAVKALGDHFAQGRLEPDEFEERMTAAYAARTAEELDRLFDDLPRSAPPQHATSYPTGQYPTGQYPHTAAFPAHPAMGHHLAVPGGHDPQAPYGRDPVSGWPYSDKSKVVAGLLQLFLGWAGVGRFYTGHTGLALAQLIVTLFTFGIGSIWGVVDGIVLLAGRPTDPQGRPLRP
jgi:TM2 domain-containing membrane protein YozV